MDHFWQRKKFKRSLLVILAVVFLCAVLALLFHPFRRDIRITTQTALAHVYSTPSTPFPIISTSQLTTTQQKIVTLARQEYAKKPVSFDANVLKYTDGNKEPWCADFASWIFREAGQPFNNPNSGSWRIPGVYTLEDYFQEKHRWQPAGNYRPQSGDVAIYSKGSGHTNIVLTVEGDTMTTIGGNENGHLRIDTLKYTAGTEGLLGFGTLTL